MFGGGKRHRFCWLDGACQKLTKLKYISIVCDYTHACLFLYLYGALFVSRSFSVSLKLSCRYSSSLVSVLRLIDREM